MIEFPTLTEAIAQGFRAYSWDDIGFYVRKETKHGVYIKALVRYAPDPRDRR